MTCSIKCSIGDNQFSPSCLHCGARYLRAIQKHPQRSAEWLRKALADWVAMGHPEADLRRMSGASSSSSQVRRSARGAQG